MKWTGKWWCRVVLTIDVNYVIQLKKWIRKANVDRVNNMPKIMTKSLSKRPTSQTSPAMQWLRKLKPTVELVLCPFLVLFDIWCVWRLGSCRLCMEHLLLPWVWHWGHPGAMTQLGMISYQGPAGDGRAHVTLVNINPMVSRIEVSLLSCSWAIWYPPISSLTWLYSTSITRLPQKVVF